MKSFTVGWRAVRVSLVLSLGALVASACGSDDGEGTGGKCSQGATRTCLGPGACNGAQSCGADGTWSACDCGGSGGAGGAGGIGGGAGSGTGGTAGGDGSAGSGGDAGDASSGGSGGGTQWQDDPCPTTPAFINCSNTCGGPTANCAQATCAGALVLKTDFPEFPYVVRTPSKPGVDLKCTGACNPPSTTYGIGLRLGFPYATTKVLKVSVPKPWWIRVDGSLQDPTYFCMSEGKGMTQECQITVLNSGITILILTDDPNAPAANAFIYEVAKPGSCP
jgi:hypothetical protein